MQGQGLGLVLHMGAKRGMEEGEPSSVFCSAKGVRQHQRGRLQSHIPPEDLENNLDTRRGICGFPSLITQLFKGKKLRFPLGFGVRNGRLGTTRRCSSLLSRECSRTQKVQQRIEMKSERGICDTGVGGNVMEGKEPRRE